MWTNRARRFATRVLPPGKLLPDRQPAYVRSWVYVFGVGSLAAFAVACVSGFALALGGPDWWRYNPVGHFFNSLHLWSVELFMALLVIHLWGKFWMAAWRGQQAWTWITGVVAFLASVVECFTGYLSHQNFDSQWISTSGKDAFNAVGIGAIWNAMNFGQMLMWHIVLLPIVLTAIIGAHILLVRVRGVSHPMPDSIRTPGRGSYRQRRRALATADAAPWRGATPLRHPQGRHHRRGDHPGADVRPGRPAVLTQPPGTVRADLGQGGARRLPGHRVHRAQRHQRDGHLRPAVQHQRDPAEDPVRPGEHPRGDPADQRGAGDFVLSPLNAAVAGNPGLAAALATYRAAPAAQQLKWANAYADAVTKVKFAGGAPVVPPAADGPVPVMLANELTMARSGALDADLLAKNAFYGTNYTLPLMFVNDGAYFANQAEAMHLGGDQWGVINETGSYPGQPWLWLYTLWYGTGGRAVSQRRPDRHLPDRPGHRPAAGRAVHPRPAGHPAADPRPPAHLAGRPGNTAAQRRPGPRHPR